MKKYLKLFIIILFIIATTIFISNLVSQVLPAECSLSRIFLEHFAANKNKLQEQIFATPEPDEKYSQENLYNLQPAKIYGLDIKKDITNYKIYSKLTTGSLHNNQYSKILFQFIQKDALQYIDTDDNDPNNPYKNLQENSVWATSFDIDNDKEEEIIGQYADYPYNGLVSGVLFIIKKYKDDYKAIYIDDFVVNVTEIRLARNLKTNKNIIILTNYERYQKIEAYSVYEF